VLEEEIRRRSGSALFDFILDDLAALRALLVDPQSHQALMAGFEARWWLDDNLEEWLGERDAADTLSLSAPATSRLRWAWPSLMSRMSSAPTRRW
jgi:pyruvate,water dikinase